MCLVLFSWMVNQDFFKELTNKNLRTSLYAKQMEELESEITPFGVIVTGLDTHKLPIGFGADTWLIGEEDEDVLSLIRSH